MSAVKHTMALASFELAGIRRSRWLLWFSAVFVVVSAVVTIAGLRSFAALGLAGAAAATDGLVHASLLLPPLLGLLLGASGLARDRERGMLAMLATQPIRRAAIPFASFAASLGAVWAVTLLGFATATLLLSTSATSADLLGLLTALTIALAATAASVALGVLVGSVARTHQQAVAAAAAVWLMLALGLDLLLVGVAPGLRLGPSSLLAVVISNPLEAARVMSLFVLDGAGALGPFGAYLMATLGRSGTLSVLTTVLAAWTIGPLVAAALIARRRQV